MTYASENGNVKEPTEAYETGDEINIAVNFSEKIYTSEGELLTDVIYKELQDSDIIYDIIDLEGKTIGYIINHVDKETANKIKDTIAKYIPDLVLDIDGRTVGKNEGVEFEDIKNIDEKTVINYSYTIKYEDFGGIEVKSLIAENKDKTVYDKAGNTTIINYSGTDFEYYENGNLVLGEGDIEVNRVKAPFVKYIVKVEDESKNWVAIDPNETNIYKIGDTFTIVAGFDGAVYADSGKETRITNQYYPLPLRMSEVEDIPIILEDNKPNTLVSISNGNVRELSGENTTNGIPIDRNLTISYKYVVGDTYTYSKGNMEIDVSNINVAIFYSSDDTKEINNYKNDVKDVTYIDDNLETLPIGIDTTVPTLQIEGNSANYVDVEPGATYIVEDNEHLSLKSEDTDIKVVQEIGNSTNTHSYDSPTTYSCAEHIPEYTNDVCQEEKYEVILTDKAGNQREYEFNVITKDSLKDELLNGNLAGGNNPITIGGLNDAQEGILVDPHGNVLTKDNITLGIINDGESDDIELNNSLKITKVEYNKNGGNLTELYPYNNSNKELPLILNETGEYIIRVTIEDASGKTYTIDYAITIDKDAPIVSTTVKLKDQTLANSSNTYKEGTKLIFESVYNEKVFDGEAYVNGNANRNRQEISKDNENVPELNVKFGGVTGTANGGKALLTDSYTDNGQIIVIYEYTIGKDDNGRISLEFVKPVESVESTEYKVYDEAGNFINLLESSQNVLFKDNEIKADTEKPTLYIELYADEEEITTGYTNEDNITVKFNWSEAITNFDISDVSISGGTLEGFNKVSENKYTATLNTSSIQNGSIRIVVEQDAARDIAGNYSVRKEITIVKDKQAPVLLGITAYAVEPYKVNVSEYVSPYKEHYKAREEGEAGEEVEAGEQVRIEAVFSETILNETLPTMNLKFGNAIAKGNVNHQVSDNKIVYTYTITKGDNGILSVGRFAGTVKDLAGNTLRVGNKTLDGDTIIADTKEPELESVNINTNNKTNIKAGDTLNIELTYTENVYNLEVNTEENTKTVINLTNETTLISSDAFTINDMTIEGNKVIYTATVKEAVNTTLNTVNYNGTVYDIAGNEFKATELPEDTTILINGQEIDKGDEGSEEGSGIVIDTTAPTIEAEGGIVVDATSDIEKTEPYYKAGTILDIKVKFSEDVTIVKGNETNGVRIDLIAQSELYFGADLTAELTDELKEKAAAKGNLKYVGYDEENRTATFSYVITEGDNGDFGLVIPENAIIDTAGNMNTEIIIEYGEDIADNKGVVADTEAPTINYQTDIKVKGKASPFIATATFSEDLYDVENGAIKTLSGAKAPKFIYKYGSINNKLEPTEDDKVEITDENGSDIKNKETYEIIGNKIFYKITIASPGIGSSNVYPIGLDGQVYDRAGNGYYGDSLFVKNVTIEPAESTPKNEYNKYKDGAAIRIVVEFNKDITISESPSMTISFDNTEHTLPGTIEDNKIIFNYTIASGDNGELKIVGMSGTVVDGTVVDENSPSYGLGLISIEGLVNSTIIADTIAPTPTVTVQNVQNSITNEDTITYTIKWDEPVIGFTQEDITVQNGTIIAYNYDETLNEATVEVLKLNDGKQVVFINEGVCEDQAGNRSSRSDITNITIDTTKPTIRALVNGGNYVIDTDTKKSRISTRLEITEELSSLRYKWSTNANDTLEEGLTSVELNNLDINDIPLEREIDSEGTWYLYIVATDKAGNEATARTKAFNVSASTIEINLNNTEKTNKDVIAEIIYGDYLTEDRLVRVGEQGSADPTKITVTENGTVYAEATDGHGNKVYATKEVTNIFKTPPTVEATVEATYEDATIKLDITDGGAGIKEVVVTDPNGQVVEPNEDGTYTATEEGTYKVTVTDEAGNVVEKEVEVAKEKLEITTDYDIIEVDGKKYIKVPKGTTVSQIIDSIIIKNSAEANINKEVYDGENKHEEGILKTGETIRIDDVERYIIVVNGDVTCDGEVNLDDVFKANRYRLKSLTSSIETLYRLAVDADNNNEIDILDIFKINRIRLSK